MKRAMISQPMNGLPEDEIISARNRATKYLEDKGYEVVDKFLSDEYCKQEKSDERNILLYFLSKSLEKMSECDAVYFCKGWEHARGCLVEHRAAVSYGLTSFYE